MFFFVLFFFVYSFASFSRFCLFRYQSNRQLRSNDTLFIYSHCCFDLFGRLSLSPYSGHSFTGRGERDNSTNNINTTIFGVFCSHWQLEHSLMAFHLADVVSFFFCPVCFVYLLLVRCFFFAPRQARPNYFLFVSHFKVLYTVFFLFSL